MSTGDSAGDEAPGSPKTSLITTASEEGGTRLAVEQIQRAAPEIARAIRRAVPFLARSGVTIEPEEPVSTNTDQLGKDFDRPIYVANLAAEPGGARAAIVIDGPAIAFILDGTLGGDGTETPPLMAKGLTTPQRAFVNRLVGNVVSSVSEELAKYIGLKLRTLPASSGERSAGGSLVAVPLRLLTRPEEDDEDEDEYGIDDEDEDEDEDEESEPGEPIRRGKLLLAISKNALAHARAAHTKVRSRPINARAAAVVREVDVEIVAELGRISLTLGQLAALRVGDTLRLDVPVNGEVDLRVDKLVLFTGQPTTSGSQLAIQLLEKVKLPEKESTGQSGPPHAATTSRPDTTTTEASKPADANANAAQGER